MFTSKSPNTWGGGGMKLYALFSLLFVISFMSSSFVYATNLEITPLGNIDDNLELDGAADIFY